MATRLDFLVLFGFVFFSFPSSFLFSFIWKKDGPLLKLMGTILSISFRSSVHMTKLCKWAANMFLAVLEMPKDISWDVACIIVLCGGGMILLLQKEMPLKACKKQKTNACRRRWERMERPVGRFFHWWGSMDAWTERMKSLLDLQMIIMCKLTPPLCTSLYFPTPPPIHFSLFLLRLPSFPFLLLLLLLLYICFSFHSKLTSSHFTFLFVKAIIRYWNDWIKHLWICSVCLNLSNDAR